MRRSLDALLSTVGYKPAFFSRPSDFLASFMAASPGCLVLDIPMPDMSGVEVQQHLNRMGSMGEQSDRHRFGSNLGLWI